MHVTPDASRLSFHFFRQRSQPPIATMHSRPCPRFASGPIFLRVATSSGAIFLYPPYTSSSFCFVRHARSQLSPGKYASHPHSIQAVDILSSFLPAGGTVRVHYVHIPTQLDWWRRYSYRPNQRLEAGGRLRVYFHCFPRLAIPLKISIGKPERHNMLRGRILGRGHWGLLPRRPDPCAWIIFWRADLSGSLRSFPFLQ